MFNIVLVNPQIPPNTGTIGRLCVNIGATLHLIEPLGFSIEDKEVKRAGLDYWHKLNLKLYKSLDDFFEAHKGRDNFHFATTKSEQLYFDASFAPGDFLFFGSEVSGIDESLLDAYKEKCITIPMGKEGRSLNLALSVGIVTYEAIKQNFESFKG